MSIFLFHCIILSQEKFLHFWTICLEYLQLSILASFPNGALFFPASVGSLGSLAFPTHDLHICPPISFRLFSIYLGFYSISLFIASFLRSRLDRKTDCWKRDDDMKKSPEPHQGMRQIVEVILQHGLWVFIKGKYPEKMKHTLKH